MHLPENLDYTYHVITLILIGNQNIFKQIGNKRQAPKNL